MSSLPRLPESFSLPLSLSLVPLVFPLRVQSRTATEVIYAAEVPYDDDGEEAIAKVTAKVVLGSDGQVSINVHVPLTTDQATWDVRREVARILGIALK